MIDKPARVVPVPIKNDNCVASPCRAAALSAASRLALASNVSWNCEAAVFPVWLRPGHWLHRERTGEVARQHTLAPVAFQRVSAANSHDRVIWRGIYMMHVGAGLQ